MPNIPPASDDVARRNDPNADRRTAAVDEAAAKARQDAAQRDGERQASNTRQNPDASQRPSQGQPDNAQRATLDRGQQSPDRTSADPSGRAHGVRGDFVLRPAADVTLEELAAAIEAAGIRVPGADVDKMAAKVSRHFADARGKV